MEDTKPIIDPLPDLYWTEEVSIYKTFGTGGKIRCDQLAYYDERPRKNWRCKHYNNSDKIVDLWNTGVRVLVKSGWYGMFHRLYKDFNMFPSYVIRRQKNYRLHLRRRLRLGREKMMMEENREYFKNLPFDIYDRDIDDTVEQWTFSFPKSI